MAPTLPALALARIFLEQQAWEACGIKLIYKQVSDKFLDYFKAENGKLFFLERRNAIRVAVSRDATRQAKQTSLSAYPYTRKTAGVPTPFKVDALAIIQVARTYRAMTQAMRDRLADRGQEYVPIIYEEMIDVKDPHRMKTALSYRLCDELKVDRRTLRCRYFPSAPLPMSQFIVNWRQLEERIKNSELADCLEDLYGEEEGPDETERVADDPAPDEDTQSWIGQQDHPWGHQPRPYDPSAGDCDSLGPE